MQREAISAQSFVLCDWMGKPLCREARGGGLCCGAGKDQGSQRWEGAGAVMLSQPVTEKNTQQPCVLLGYFKFSKKPNPNTT